MIQMTTIRVCLGSSLAATLLLTTPAYGQDTITFADIYAAPDDEALNLAYARQQAEAGELSQAAATLERMLYAKPNWDSVRLFYALVLTRLDDQSAAQREFALLDNRPLSPAQRETLERYKAGGDQNPRAMTSLRGRVSIGARYDDNAGNAIGDVVFGGADEPDESLMFRSVTEITAPVSRGSETQLVLRGDVQSKRHEEFSDADYDVYGLQGGFRGAVGEGGIGWMARAEFMKVKVASQNYLNRSGATVGFDGGFSDNTRWTFRVSGYGEDYDNLTFTTAEPERSGARWIADVGLSHQLTSTLNLGVNLAYEDKAAKNAALAYDGWRLRGRAKWDVSRGIYLSANGEYRELNYDADSPFLFPFAPRADENLRLNGAVGASLPWVEGVSVELGANYYNRNTNIPDADYENIGGEFRLIYDY